MALDALLAVTLAAVSVVYGQQAYEAAYRAAGWPRFGPVAIGLSVAVNLPLALRHCRPRTALAASGTALLCFVLAGFQPSVNVWAPMLACYCVVTARPGHEARWWAAGTAALWLATGLQARLSIEMALAQSVIGTGVMWFFATRLRRLGKRNVQLADLTERLRIEQELRARQAVSLERLRIARELHDVVAHHLAALAVQSGTAGYLHRAGTDHEQVGAALEAIGDTSREALEEMRSLLQVLRVDPQSTGELDDLPDRATPGTSQLQGLLERAKAVGLDITLTVTGKARPLPPGIDQCAYRVFQEALTNVIKHAGRPVNVTLTLHYAPALVTGRAVDNGTGRDPAMPSAGSGLGLVGMAERVALYGGTLRAGPGDGGGFAVEFSLPTPPTGSRPVAGRTSGSER
ncbi:sensor histidine kinase [Kitasatospora sp. NPDC096147]|uniref:sensor histidine kinase n=1 Tax=Kitasatospora sp. NPDC096147 TaxID=3364093 RepID=UPI0037F91ABE